MVAAELTFAIGVLSYLFLATGAQLPCDQLGYHPRNQSFEFSMIGTKNQTGHWKTQFLLNKSSPKMSNNWKVDLKHSISEYGGIDSFQIHGVLSVPPPRPMDYELYPGIGFYKFHYGTRTSFADASATCAREGGHLAIINSEEESTVLKNILGKNLPEGAPLAYVGIYDPSKKGNFVTIYGQPLSETGFSRWNINEPSNPTAYCGIIHTTGLLGVASCNDKLSFICEYDYSWSDL